MIKTGMEFIKFIYTTPICRQLPANQNDYPYDVSWVKHIITADNKKWSDADKAELRARIFDGLDNN